MVGGKRKQEVYDEPVELSENTLVELSYYFPKAVEMIAMGEGLSEKRAIMMVMRSVLNGETKMGTLDPASRSEIAYYISNIRDRAEEEQEV